MVESEYIPQGRTERLIAIGRVVLAASSLIAIWLDPSQPEKYAAATYTVMAIYVVYALGLAGAVWMSPVSGFRFQLGIHALDLLAFSLFIFLTEGPPTSPFFVYFIFSILCATLRWGWRGTLWTSLFSVGMFLGMALLGGGVLDDERLNRFIIRSVYLSVVAIMLGYLGAYEQQLRGEIAKLTGWPRRVPLGTRDVTRETVEYAANVMSAPRVLMVWEESEEPWVYHACWSHGNLAWEREPPGALEPVVAGPLGDHAFLCRDVTASLPTVLGAMGPAALRPWRGVPLHVSLQRRYAIRTVLGVRLAGDAFHGWLFFLDKGRMTLDDLMLGQIVGGQVAARLEHSYLLQRLQQSAVLEERMRFARDLHDGLLQSLAGTALQLHNLRRTLAEHPHEVMGRLHELEHSILAEQGSLRAFIRELRPRALLPHDATGDLATSLRNLVDRVERQWGLRVDLTVGHLDASGAEALSYHVSHIVHEALVNAARHGGASSVRVEVEERGGEILILAADNGHGFGFHGRYDVVALTRMNVGPVSLKERITALGGTLTVESSASGARLEITFPLGRTAV